MSGESIFSGTLTITPALDQAAITQILDECNPDLTAYDYFVPSPDGTVIACSGNEKFSVYWEMVDDLLTALRSGIPGDGNEARRTYQVNGTITGHGDYDPSDIDIIVVTNGAMQHRIPG